MENPSSENGARPSKTVPCPRCQSLNTKFCYFNNHNVNQPRHFCRDCQRYWTAGGSLRNVPVGAGKRKHKGPLAVSTKIDNLPNIFSFSGNHLDQGVYNPPLDAPSVLSLKQHVPHTHGENKQLETPTVSQSAFISMAKPLQTSAIASHRIVPGSHGEMNASEKQDLVRPGCEKKGFSDMMKKPSLALGLTLSKETDAKEDQARPPLHINVPHDFTSLHQGPAKRPPQHVTERDESTGCSSVTANLGSSASEAFAESNTPSMRAPPLPSADQAPSVLNPMAAWSASMCPPWLWPFIMSGRNVTSPASIPQVDPSFAAAMGAMASMSPIHPAFAAAMGAMASGGGLPQVDPNIMAALTASFLQLPHIWNPYTWGLQWNAAWNMANAGVNAPNGVNKRPASPTQEQGHASKMSKKDHTDEVAHSNGVHTADVANVQNVPLPAGCFDAFNSKVGAFQRKDTASQQSEEHLDPHQSPHMNPAAQARSAAFHEGT